VGTVAGFYFYEFPKSASQKVTTVPMHPTTTNVACTPQTMLIGQATTCTATVTDSSSFAIPTAPTGTVTFNLGGICTLSLSGASASCSTSLTQAAPGSLFVSARYLGDIAHEPSTGGVSVTVNDVVPDCSDPASISSHVYNPSRLQIVKDCITASGTVDRVIEENDGDVHLRLMLDPAYSNLTNSANDLYQYGDLVVEIICVGQITQADAVSACQNYSNNIPVPNVGQRITVSGPYVLDTDHYNWAEIHPVYSLTVSGASVGATVNVEENLFISYPGGVTSGWLGLSPRSLVTGATVDSGNQFSETLSLYSTSAYPEQITSITVSNPGFSLASVSPSPPISFNAGETVSITLVIQSPDVYYHGPLDIEIATA